MTENEKRMKAALEWIATVNETIDLRKLDAKLLIGLIYELRAKAKAALKEVANGD